MLDFPRATWEQKRLVADPGHKRTVRTRVTKDGVKPEVKKQQGVLPWWRMAPNGSVAFFVRASQKPIEFEKGKAAIAVASLDKLPSVIDTLITAIRNGELDEHLAAAAKSAQVRKAKKAA